MHTKHPNFRQFLRAATRIREHLTGPGRLRDVIDLPLHAWETASTTVRRLELAVKRGWLVAGDQLLQDLDYDLRRLRSELDMRHTELPREARSDRVARLGDILADLAAVEQEFDGFEVDLQARTVEAWAGRAVISTLSAFGGATGENFKKLRAAGATVLYGTDFGNTQLAGISGEEIDLLLAAGLDGQAIVTAMTSAPAQYWRLDRQSPPGPGLLVVGGVASFMIVAADPRVPLACPAAEAVSLPRGPLNDGSLRDVKSRTIQLRRVALAPPV